MQHYSHHTLSYAALQRSNRCIKRCWMKKTHTDTRVRRAHAETNKVSVDLFFFFRVHAAQSLGQDSHGSPSSSGAPSIISPAVTLSCPVCVCACVLVCVHLCMHRCVGGGLSPITLFWWQSVKLTQPYDHLCGCTGTCGFLIHYSQTTADSMGRARTRWRWIEGAGTGLNLNIKHLSMLIHRRRPRKQMIIEILNLNLGFNLVALTPPTPTILLQKGSGAFRG